jgi:hypothetical protein
VAWATRNAAIAEDELKTKHRSDDEAGGGVGLIVSTANSIQDGERNAILLTRLALSCVTVHGFRPLARLWPNEEAITQLADQPLAALTNFPRCYCCFGFDA